MSFSDYLLDIVLIALVLRQVREARLDLKAVLIPIVICAIVAKNYLHGIPATGNNLELIGGFTLVGVACGVLSAMTTRVRADGGRFALIKAGPVAAGTWVASMGFRFGFAIWAAHGGDASIARFSAEHHITTASAWTSALVLMALGEVFVRTGLLVFRGQRALHAYVSRTGKTLAAA